MFVEIMLHFVTSAFLHEKVSYSLSTLSWRGLKTSKIVIHLTENGSSQHHVIIDGRYRTHRLNAINKKQKLRKESQLSAASN